MKVLMKAMCLKKYHNTEKDFTVIDFVDMEAGAGGRETRCSFTVAKGLSIEQVPMYVPITLEATVTPSQWNGKQYLQIESLSGTK